MQGDEFTYDVSSPINVDPLQQPVCGSRRRMLADFTAGSGARAMQQGAQGGAIVTYTLQYTATIETPTDVAGFLAAHGVDTTGLDYAAQQAAALQVRARFAYAWL